MKNTREWTHTENPEAVPSAATARLGCKCPECKAALREYLRAYRARMQATKENIDGTAVYHNHAGQPSKGTARKWMCVHPRCLKLAGLMLSPEGVVVDITTGLADATFGAMPAKVA